MSEPVKLSRPRGTADVLPAKAVVWRQVEAEMHRVCRLYGYGELRPPMFEVTELFRRGVGETTDIVEKEMYTFESRGGDSYTLRPELTAGMVRAFVENNLGQEMMPAKVYGIGPAFRYEKPQAGRYRQFTQWDVEVFGSQDPALDAEVIQLGLDLAGRLGLTGLTVSLNSLGCPECRPKYRQALQDYFRPHLGGMCADCQGRFERNPLRLIDCKVDRALAGGAPRMLDYLCEECDTHFAAVQRYLTGLGASYTIDPGIVRGLDYYTKTVFEVIYPGLGAQNTVWGGGRYDGLMEQLGGPALPGVGFAVGVERLLLTLEKSGLWPDAEPVVDVFIAVLGDGAKGASLQLANQLRQANVRADCDYLGRSLKSQLRQAGRLGARYAVIVGEDEVNRGVGSVRDMNASTQTEVPLAELASWLGQRLGS